MLTYLSHWQSYLVLPRSQCWGSDDCQSSKVGGRVVWCVALVHNDVHHVTWSRHQPCALIYIHYPTVTVTTIRMCITNAVGVCRVEAASSPSSNFAFESGTIVFLFVLVLYDLFFLFTSLALWSQILLNSLTMWHNDF